MSFWHLAPARFPRPRSINAPCADREPPQVVRMIFTAEANTRKWKARILNPVGNRREIMEANLQSTMLNDK